MSGHHKWREIAHKNRPAATRAVNVRIPHVTYRLEPEDVELLVDELEKLERPVATSVAATLLSPPDPYRPTDADIVELARALDHLRNLDTLPKERDAEVFGVSRLRDNLVSRFRSHTYRLDPQTGEQPFGSFSYGPRHAVGDRLVDMATSREWTVLGIREGTDALELVVEPWR